MKKTSNCFTKNTKRPRWLYRVTFHGTGIDKSFATGKPIQTEYHGVSRTIIADDALDAIERLKRVMVSLKKVHSVERVEYVDF